MGDFGKEKGEMKIGLQTFGAHFFVAQFSL